MKKHLKIVSLLLTFSLLMPLYPQSAAATVPTKVQTATSRILQSYEGKSVLDWAAFGLSLNGETPSGHISQMAENLSSNHGDFRLVTDLARTVITLRAAQREPSAVGGYNLISKIANFDQIGKQGVNGPAFALIALNWDPLPKSAKWTRESLISQILTCQNTNGGFGLTTDSGSDVDLTAICLAALAPYQSLSNVKTHVASGVSYLKNNFYKNGSSESLSQVIIALSALGHNPCDTAFYKNGRSLIDQLLTYQNSDGRFAHTSGGASNPIATEQALIALTAYRFYLQNKGGVYGTKPPFNDLATASVSFIDSILKAKDLGIVKGDSDGNITPQKSLTRAEFVTMLLNMLKVRPAASYERRFYDVSSSSWYWGYVQKAQDLKIINGNGSGAFLPDGVLTRENTAVILTNTYMLPNIYPARNFWDIQDAAAYARQSATAVCRSSVWFSTSMTFSPRSTMTREQAITVLVNVHESSATRKS